MVEAALYHEVRWAVPSLSAPSPGRSERFNVVGRAWPVGQSGAGAALDVPAADGTRAVEGAKEACLANFPGGPDAKR